MENWYYAFGALLLTGGVTMLFWFQESQKTTLVQQDTKVVVRSIKDMNTLFNQDASSITHQCEVLIGQGKKTVTDITLIPNEQRTFENTVYALDMLLERSPLAVAHRVFSLLEMVSPLKDVQEEAHKAALAIQKFFIEQIMHNKKVYEAIAYCEEQKDLLCHSDEQRYFLQELVKEFKRNGMELSEEERNKVEKLRTKIAELAQEFEKNIAQDNRTISVKREALAGLSDTFIASLVCNEEGLYSVGIDNPTYTYLMDYCSVEDTRKQLYEAYSNRAYPANKALLYEIIQMRKELAQLLGYETYAAYELDNEMIKSVERATQFLDDLVARASLKEEKEYEQLIQDLPDSVELTDNATIKPWDSSYLKAYYKRKMYDIDEALIAEYFPLHATINGLMALYEQFLTLTLTTTQFPEELVLWHEEVQCIQVRDKKTGHLLGYVVLDLHPRENKFSHACAMTVVPAVRELNGEEPVAVSVVIANFPPATADKPSLLKRNDVSTLFHEFGHALHAVLGRTTMAGFSGTHVKRDFVEMPSQMLEEWLWDKETLRSLSAHYRTHAQLDESVIDRLIAMRHYNTGLWILAQIVYSYMSLFYFEDCIHKSEDLGLIANDLQQRIMSHYAVDPSVHRYASFGHLMGYGARYYGYLWSKVYALDLFNEIEKVGLGNAAIGEKYRRTILSPGGSKDPNQLLYDFLGREPSSEAFFTHMNF
ncbi:MAG: M3 family metallopeptidase [Candidatus Babeliales bacterium]